VEFSMNGNYEVLSKLISDNRLNPYIILFHMNTYKHGDIYLDHVHNNAIEIMYVFNGYLYMEVNKKYIKINKNECLIVFPDTVHSLIMKKNEKCTAGCIVFNPGNLSNSNNMLDISCNISFLYKITKNEPGYIKIIANNFIKTVIEEMYHYNLNRNEFSQELMKLYFCELYIYLSEALNENFIKQCNYENHYINNAIEYINNHYSNDISVKDVARTVRLSDRHLTRLFESELNMSVHEYITFLRIEKAKKMLKDPRQNITNISLRLGFNTSQYFATTFKKYENISPSSYRKR
jgi:AraC-like DNA-binding protein